MQALTRVLSAAIVAVGIALVPSVTHAAVPISAVSLHLSDLPAGFTQTQNAVGNLQDEGGPASELAATFQAKALIGGLITVDVSLEHLFSTAAAHRAFERVVQATAKTKSYHFKPVSASHLGDESFGLTASITAKSNVSLTLDVFVFRRGAYVAAVLGSGITHTFSAASVADLARIIIERIDTEG